jgi:uncharacterized protein (DUF58 family)
MIVPRSRLVLGVGLMVVPLATMAGAVPATLALSGSLIVVLLGFALLDAFLGFRRMDGIRVELPEVVRLSKDREGAIELCIRYDGMGAKCLRLGLPFPREIFSANEDLFAALPKKGAYSRLLWPCKPLKRGRYTLDKCYLEVASPLGFWSIRAVTATHTEIHVYPSLFAERRHMAALFLNRGPLGIHAHRQVGKGREFEKLREYGVGDSFEDIHWKATAKRRYPITKVFQIERMQEVYVIIDASRLSCRRTELLVDGSPSGSDIRNDSQTTVLERFVMAALAMGLAAERQGDLFGLLTYSDRVQTFVRAKNGAAHYNICRDALYTLQPQEVAVDFRELFAFLGLKLRRRAFLVFLINLDDCVLAENFVGNVDLICRRHLVLVNMLRPKRAKPLFSGPEVESLDEMYQGLCGHFLWSDLRELEKVLWQRGIRFSLLDNEKMCTQLVSQYTAVKQRQLL